MCGWEKLVVPGLVEGGDKPLGSEPTTGGAESWYRAVAEDIALKVQRCMAFSLICGQRGVGRRGFRCGALPGFGVTISRLNGEDVPVAKPR